MGFYTCLNCVFFLSREGRLNSSLLRAFVCGLLASVIESLFAAGGAFVRRVPGRARLLGRPARTPVPSRARRPVPGQELLRDGAERGPRALPRGDAVTDEPQPFLPFCGG